MHIITRKRLLDFATKNPACSTALNAWYRILKHSTVLNFAELRTIFPSADQVEGLTVFNIGGNKARLIAVIHYNTQRLYIRHVLTHKEYDKNKWKEG
jgi:mRNA interferase HigB